ncbi:MAG: hypothetical protein ACXVEK_14585, partial [Nocardioides sp.]
ALTEQGVKVDSSRVSRWESGLHPVSAQVLATYESALGLAEGSLVAVAAGLRRAFGGSLRDSLPTVDLNDGELDNLLDLAESGKATGAHWLQVVGHLDGYERVFLRHRDWADLSTTLVGELAVSVGVGYVRRYEAAATLVRNPHAQRHLTRAIGSFVTHPDTQVVAPVLSLLTEMSDAAAGDLVLRMLTAEDKNLRSAAASVAAVKVSRGHFGEHALPHLESHVVGSLRRGESLDGRLDSFDLAVHLPDESWEHAKGGLRNRRAFDLVIDSRKGGELVPSRQTAAVVQRLAGAVQRDTPTHSPHEPDAMLRRLLREALLHAHKPRRHHAALLLAATPYAPAVAKHCQDLANHNNDLLAARALTVLMRVGHRAGRSRVLLQSLAEIRPTIRARALVNVGLNPEPLRPAEADALLGKLEEGSRPVERHATLFALGMSGAPAVHRLAEGPDSDPTARAARWWVQRGPALHDADAYA